MDPICGANIRLRAAIRDDLATPISDIAALISIVARIRSTCSSNRGSKRIHEGEYVVLAVTVGLAVVFEYK